MRLGFGAKKKGGMRSERGGVAVEFALIFPILMLLVFGIIDFGHAWYMKHLMSDASREGARYATRYWTVGTHRTLPKDLTPTITNFVLQTSAENGGKGGWGLKNLLPADADPQVFPEGAGATWTDVSTVAGKDLIIRITATKTWFVLGSLVPGFGSSKTLTVSTTMTCE
jgi:Flp pilus assembly protein TadG